MIKPEIVSYIKSKLSLIIIMALALVLLSIVYKDKPKEVVITPDIIEEPILKPIPPKVPEKVEEVEACTDTKTYILKTDDFLSRENVIILDLNNFKLSKSKRIDKNRVGYYYVQHGNIDKFYTEFRHEPKEEEKFVTLPTTK